MGYRHGNTLAAQSQYQAAAAMYDNASPFDEADDARQEAIDERTDELLDKYAADEAKVLEAVEGVNTLGFEGLIDRRLRDFLMDWRKAPDEAAPLVEAGRYLFDALWPHVEAQLRADAAMDAEHEQAQRDAAQAEMRDFYRGKAA